MKKIFTIILFLMILAPITSIVYSTDVCFGQNFEVEEKTNGEEYVCIANFCYLYANPTFTAEKITQNEENIKITHKDLLQIEIENKKAVEYFDIDSEDMKFYKVLSYNELELQEAYIYSDFVTKNIQNIEQFPTFNASVNTDTVLFVKNGDEMTELLPLEKGTRIFLYEGYNNTQTYLKVAVKVENSIEYGYVKKEDVAPDGINPAIIYAITIAIACLGIIFALLFMKNKKKKK